MSKYILLSPHKCGSTILHRIISSISQQTKNDSFLLSDGYIHQKLFFSRKIFNCRNYDRDGNYVLVTRNPISICISMFYSLGYTHTIPKSFTEEQKKKFYQERDSILHLSLEEFISLNLEKQCSRMQSLLDLDINKKIVLPYEFMISNFHEFLHKFLSHIGLPSLHTSIYHRWSHEFKPIQDLSRDIVEGKVKSHKRTTDIYEWKHKLNKGLQEQLCHTHPFILDYDHFLQTKFNL